MWELRLIIILIGVVFIALVYLLSRQRRSRRNDLQRHAPTLAESDLPETHLHPDLSPAPAPAVGGDTRSANPLSRAETKPDRLILSLHVASKESAGFDGASVLAALQANGLQYGQYHVFHRLLKSEPGQSVFSVANMVEPGILEPQELPQRRIPGLTLFLLLPGPQDGVAACADMLATARALARLLEGEVQDERHIPLSSQSAQQIRQRILDFQHAIQAPIR